MTEALKGKTVGEAEELFAKFHAMVTDDGSPAAGFDELGKLAVFAEFASFRCG